MSLVGTYGYDAERNRGPIALLVLVLMASGGSLAVPPTKVLVPRGARDGANAIARLKDANEDFVGVVRSTPREPSGSPALTGFLYGALTCVWGSARLAHSR